MKAVRGDFGKSLRFAGEPAHGLVLERLPATAMLAAACSLWSLPLPLVLGVVSALRRHRWLLSPALPYAPFGQSIPNFLARHRARHGVLSSLQSASCLRTRCLICDSECMFRAGFDSIGYSHCLLSWLKTSSTPG
jgi:hypothetical protein